MVTNNYLTTAIGEAVNRTESKVLAQLQEFNPAIVGLNYQFGHIADIYQTLNEWNWTPEYQAQKFPLVWLVMDASIQTGRVGRNDTVRFDLVIANQTNNTYKAADREVNNFIPILRPIYKELMSAIADSRYFSIGSKDTITHEYIERYYWGRDSGATPTGTNNTANTFPDFIDAIHLRGLELPLNYNCSFPVNAN